MFTVDDGKLVHRSASSLTPLLEDLKKMFDAAEKDKKDVFDSYENNVFGFVVCLQ